MELKCGSCAACRDARKGSNRTFMELKCRHIVIVNECILRSNRTFMELKYLFKIFDVTSKIVLIVPLWN